MPEVLPDLAEIVERDGFAVVEGVVDPGVVDELVAAIDRAGPMDALLRREEEVYGMRDLLRSIPEVRALAASRPLADLVERVIGPGAFAVRGLLFDKTAAANWGVPWHQDLTIAVKSRVDAEGYGPWNVKGGIPHVRPPIGVIAAMLTVRVHLDPCGADRGPLRAIPGSHRDGRLGAETTRDRVDRGPIVDCLVDRGGAVLMRPLVLHASSSATDPGRRRVVHLEYARGPLPSGVEWFERVGRQGL